MLYHKRRHQAGFAQDSCHSSAAIFRDPFAPLDQRWASEIYADWRLLLKDDLLKTVFRNRLQCALLV